MITRREIRARVMQAVFACNAQDETPEKSYQLHLKETEEEVIELEKNKGIPGDLALMKTLYNETLKNTELYNGFLKNKTLNWDLDRIARVDLILMHMAICEVLNFEDIPVKVTLNEYLELAKQYSTPDSSRFINGILDNLFNELKNKGLVSKKGRGLKE